MQKSCHLRDGMRAAVPWWGGGWVAANKHSGKSICVPTNKPNGKAEIAKPNECLQQTKNKRKTNEQPLFTNKRSTSDQQSKHKVFL